MFESKPFKVVTKPWGREIWLELNDRYCYKRIFVNAGTRTSFQYHDKKYETNYIISGEAEVWLENVHGVVEKFRVKEGDFFNVPPPRKHRIIALTDLILQEVSTPEVDDVIRIADDAGRGDGRIESEHK
ncbi:MAG: cupin domain-containing protein [Patescibacteria group bacterium]